MQRYIAFDVETPNEKNHRMSAIGISVIEGGQIVRDFYSLVNPETYFADFNTRLTGITPEMVSAAPNFPTLWREIEPLMASGILVAHNAPFDLGVLDRCLHDYRIPWQPRVPYLCTVQMGRKILPGMSHKLNVLCDFYGIDLRHHQADSDSRACAEILLRYLESGEQPEDYLRHYSFSSLAEAGSGDRARQQAEPAEASRENAAAQPSQVSPEGAEIRAARKILLQVYGHEDFREGQQEIIESLLRHQDAFCVMPTGSGKSLCYQIPALLFPGTTLVISPLISLMKDQVAALRSRGIPAACLNSAMSWEDTLAVRRQAASGKIKILYVAPERLLSPDFVSFCRSFSVPFVAVDEAHCISQWGQDFRPSYLRIPEFIAQLPERPVTGAFTATATPLVRKDILRSLSLQAPVCVTAGFDRPNLSFSVYTPQDRDQALLQLLRDRYRQSGIVYCATRKAVESVCAMLQEAGFSATRYHAGLEKEERTRNQEDFLFDRSRIMVATNAFGMGIDKSNVSFVIHYQMPMSLEAYYQEAGRAGRDGCGADCILLYSGQDVMLNRWLIEHGEGNPDLTPEQQAQVQAQDQERLKQMTFYARSKRCLRQNILRYFGENAPDFCGNCSVCTPDCGHLDITVPSQMILSSIARTGSRLPEDAVISLLRGIRPASLPEGIQTETLSTFGLMKDDPEAQIRDQIRALADQGYLDRAADGSGVLLLNSASGDVLFRKQRVVMRRAAAGSAAPAASPGSESLFQALQHLRYQISGEEHIAASALLTDGTLREICRLLPRDKQALARVDGMGIFKANHYGDRILQVIASFRSIPGPVRFDGGRHSTGISGRAGSGRAQSRGAASEAGYSQLQKKLRTEDSPSAFESWSPEEDARLAAEFRQHKTPKEMSALHGRTRGAILHRLKKLKLI